MVICDCVTNVTRPGHKAETKFPDPAPFLSTTMSEIDADLYGGEYRLNLRLGLELKLY